MSDRGLARRPRNVRPDEANLDHANLDDLLGSDEPSTSPQRPATRARPWVLRSALKAFAASAVVYTTFHVSGLAPPYPLILAVCLGAVLVRQAVAMTSEPSTQRVIDAVAPPSLGRPLDATGWYEGGDGMLDAVHRWDRRLHWGSGGPNFFASTVVVRLGELADERLRLRHDITRASDPMRARALLGEQVWAVLHEPTDRVPKPQEIAAATDRLDQL
jgi:hypothetical protein